MKAPAIMPQGGKNRMPTSMPAVAPREAYFVPPVTRVSQAGQHGQNTAEKAYDAEYHGYYVNENFHIVRQSELSVRKCNIFGNLSKTYGRY